MRVSAPLRRMTCTRHQLSTIYFAISGSSSRAKVSATAAYLYSFSLIGKFLIRLFLRRFTILL